jgi:hypothetical protein
MLLEMLRLNYQFELTKMGMNPCEAIFRQPPPLLGEEVVDQVNEGALSRAILTDQNEPIVLQPHIHRATAMQADHLETGQVCGHIAMGMR